MATYVTLFVESYLMSYETIIINRNKSTAGIQVRSEAECEQRSLSGIAAPSRKVDHEQDNKTGVCEMAAALVDLPSVDLGTCPG